MHLISSTGKIEENLQKNQNTPVRNAANRPDILINRFANQVHQNMYPLVIYVLFE